MKTKGMHDFKRGKLGIINSENALLFDSNSRKVGYPKNYAHVIILGQSPLQFARCELFVEIICPLGIGSILRSFISEFSQGETG